MRELGVGIVGYGFIGKVHAYAHAALPFFYDPPAARTRLVGVCTQSEQSGAKAMRDAGFTFSTTQYADLLDRDDIDIIHCCTPNDLHEALLLDALAAGKHIYCDKPLTRTRQEAQRVADAARGVSTVHRMTFNCRTIPATQRAAELIRDGFLGEVYHFRAEYLHAGYVDPKRPYTWRLDFGRSGGGAIMDLGVHVLDTVRWLLGDCEAIRAELRTGIKQRPLPGGGGMRTVDVDDIALAQLRMVSGAIGTVEASRLATGVQDEFRWAIHGSRGSIEFNMMDPNWLTVYDATVPEGPLGGSRGPQRLECASRYVSPYKFGAPKNPVGWPQFHVACLHEFVSDVESGTLGNPNFFDGLEAQKMVDACLVSAERGTWASVQGD